jgi:serine/threonine-protein kinase
MREGVLIDPALSDRALDDLRGRFDRRRSDRRGAFRLACYVFVVSLLAWLLQTSRGAQPASVLVLVMGVQIALYRSVLLWLFYLALEPYVRRLWPEALISWNRLLAGRFRDPLVGRDILIGLLLGVATRVLWQINALAPSWLGLGPPSLFGPQRSSFGVPLQTLLGTRYCLGQLFQFHVSAVSGCLFVLLFLFLLRLVLRKQWLAACGYVLIWTPIWSIGVGHPYVSWFAAGVSCTLVVFLLTRFGLVALIGYTCARLMLNYPITADLSKWYAGGTTVLPLAVILALAGWALHTAVGVKWTPRTGPPAKREFGR